MARIRTVNPLTLREYKALVEGIPIYCPNATFVVAGQTFTATAAVTFISNVLNAVAATATAKGAWKDAIQVEDKLVAQDGATVKEIRNVIASMFSNAVNTLDAFEIAPRKPYVPLSADKRGGGHGESQGHAHRPRHHQQEAEGDAFGQRHGGGHYPGDFVRGDAGCGDGLHGQRRGDGTDAGGGDGLSGCACGSRGGRVVRRPGGSGPRGASERDGEVDRRV